MDTREVVERYYETVNAGDWETWLTVFDEHVVVDEQLAGHMEGVGAMREEADALRATYPTFRMDPEHVVVEGEEACAIWHCTAVSASGGEKFSVRVSYDGDANWGDVMMVFNACTKVKIAECGLIPLRGDKAAADRGL